MAFAVRPIANAASGVLELGHDARATSILQTHRGVGDRLARARLSVGPASGACYSSHGSARRGDRRLRRRQELTRGPSAPLVLSAYSLGPDSSRVVAQTPSAIVEGVLYA
jgi:hypothetical protein